MLMRLVFKEIGDSLACIYLSTGAQGQPKALDRDGRNREPDNRLRGRRGVAQRLRRLAAEPAHLNLEGCAECRSCKRPRRLGNHQVGLHPDEER
jgi:hypothetical protein